MRNIVLLTKLLVSASVVALGAWVAWWFWFARGPGERARGGERGVQEATVVVKGGYTPDLVVVEAGKPVRLHFRREETAVCSERVLLPAFQRAAALPTGQTVTLEFTPREPGEYEFSCQMGMYRGRIVVEPPAKG